MQLSEMMRYSFNALRQRSIRSWLTIIGIVVGITAIVVLIGLVQGLRDYFTSQLSTFGAQTIIIMPTNVENAGSASSFMPSSGKLFMKDVERIKRIPDIEVVTPVVAGRSSIGFKDKLITTSIMGIEPDNFKESSGSITIEKGRFLQPSDQKSVVIGFSISNDTFKETVPLGSTLTIAGKDYRVVGVLNRSGNSFSNLDSAIFVSIEEGRALFSDTLAEREVSIIRVVVKEGQNVQEVASRIEDEMLSAHRVNEDDKDFSVISADFINKQLDQVTGILGLFLGGVASISLVVGGVGIANTMFMSVAERRREIGTLKSLGAREAEIEKLFLVESSMIGIAGGVLGLLLAYALAFIITMIAGVGVAISPLVVAFAIVFSAGIGIVSGVFPARQAARLDPVEALSG